MNCLRKSDKCVPVIEFDSNFDFSDLASTTKIHPRTNDNTIVDTEKANLNFKQIDLHEKSRMPEEGWIHSCVNCGLFTASTILFSRSTYLNNNCEFWFYLCKYCNNSISDNVKDYILFSKKCSNMIRKYKINNIKIDLKGTNSKKKYKC